MLLARRLHSGEEKCCLHVVCTARTIASFPKCCWASRSMYPMHAFASCCLTSLAARAAAVDSVPFLSQKAMEGVFERMRASLEKAGNLPPKRDDR